MRLAFLADIHGNLPALEAVIADLHEYAPDAVYLVGDQINRCPWHNEVLDLLESQGWPAIYGNHEQIIAIISTDQNRSPFTDKKRFPTLWWTQAQLTPHHLQALRQLPAERLIATHTPAPIYLTHGIPGNPFRGFFPEDSDTQISEFLQTIAQPYVISAHTHRPLDRSLLRVSPSQRLGEINQPRLHIFNPGSIGLPYNGDPRAQYLLLDATPTGWQPTFRQVEYDWDRLERAFAESPMREEVGPEVDLHLRTALTGLPWSSDFNYWLGQQAQVLQHDMNKAVPIYLEHHGPGRWAFMIYEE